MAKEGWALDGVAFFEGELVPLAHAKVSIATHAFNYGTGCFEGIRAYWNADERQLYLLKADAHYRRMLRSAHILTIQIPYSVEELVQWTLELLRANHFESDVYIRPLAYKADPAIKVSLGGLRDAFSMFALPMGDYVPVQGLRVQVSSWRRLSDNMIPSRAKVTGAYINAALASEQAHRDGYDEAIMLADDGHVSEASSSNLFLVRQGTLVTTPVTADILEGVTRQLVLELAQANHIPVEIRPIDRTELYTADELFLCGTGVQLAAITEVDHRVVGTGGTGRITGELQSQYFQAVRGQLDAFREWVIPVY
ncbi:branched-chain amino acid aminotransferase [Sulfobacillus acidophilus TPY]|uniref:Branched-chain-amino-acid aminotransferase n=1 Tax=Sulfobacillus acidophilus (strain ATCC 700253 / DSM 10332 / NAL) TaxID=679936 RepID=G8TYX9_SULAD|nr:branched-chain amino acid aminotransferase [Sulfobacillus acidophilus TPY]AEW05158.1 branched-chain amino acid aminotransferase [Sulfobacillus acidophilus DSM 10332]